MNEKQLEGKQIFWANKWYSLWLLVIPICLFVDVLTTDKYSLFFSWLVLIAVPLFTAYVLYYMFHPKFVWLDETSIDGKKLWKRKMEIIFADAGAFSYTEKGFGFTEKGQTNSFLWEDLDSILVYKRDLVATDQLNMELFFKTRPKLHLIEETDGFYQFMDRIKQVFPSIDKEFEAALMFPAFETNLTLIYDSGNRSLKEVLNQHVNSQKS